MLCNGTEKGKKNFASPNEGRGRDAVRVGKKKSGPRQKSTKDRGEGGKNL